jgi:hypothetical protein
VKTFMMYQLSYFKAWFHQGNLHLYNHTDLWTSGGF